MFVFRRTPRTKIHAFEGKTPTTKENQLHHSRVFHEVSDPSEALALLYPDTEKLTLRVQISVSCPLGQKKHRVLGELPNKGSWPLEVFT